MARKETTDDTEGTRVGWIDAAKGIGIILVVAGHVLRGLMDASIASHDGVFGAADTWIYMFHMPLFFLLSGLFAARLSRRSPGELLVDRLAVLAYPYFLWSSLLLLVGQLLSGHTNSAASISGILALPVQPVGLFWFLYALLLISVVESVATRLGVPPRVFVAVCVALYFVPVPGGTWSVLLKVKNNAVYYAVAAAWSHQLLDLRLSRPMALATAGLGAVMVTLGARFGAPATGVPGLVGGLAGTAGVIALAQLQPAVRPAEGLRYLGRHSLEIYVSHVFATAGTRIALTTLGIEAASVHVGLGILAGLALPLLLVQVTHALGVRGVFTFPVRRPQAPLQAASTSGSCVGSGR